MAKKVEAKKKTNTKKETKKVEAKNTSKPVEKAAEVIKKVDKEKSVKVEKKEIKKDRGLLLATIGIIAVIVLAVVSFIIPENPNNKKSGKVQAMIIVKDMGNIILELDRDTAPITVDNFLELANSGFYDGVSFHRILKDFMIQGGDPDGTGSGGSDKTIKGEFEANGVKNDISHVRGVISMARNDSDMDSASSQFFIVQTDSTFLDGYYAAFGHVISGMDVVDAIMEKYGTEEDEILPEGKRPVIESIREMVLAEEE